MGKPKYSKPTSQVDLEARLKDDYVSPSVINQGVDPVYESENGYVAVDPIYQHFANETEKPLASESGVEKKLEEVYYNEDTDFDAGATAEGEGSEEDEDEEEEEETPPAPSPNTPPTNTPLTGQQS